MIVENNRAKYIPSCLVKVFFDGFGYFLFTGKGKVVAINTVSKSCGIGYLKMNSAERARLIKAVTSEVTGIFVVGSPMKLKSVGLIYKVDTTICLIVIGCL